MSSFSLVINVYIQTAEAERIIKSDAKIGVSKEPQILRIPYSIIIKLICQAVFLLTDNILPLAQEKFTIRGFIGDF